MPQGRVGNTVDDYEPVVTGLDHRATLVGCPQKWVNELLSVGLLLVMQNKTLFTSLKIPSKLTVNLQILEVCICGIRYTLSENSLTLRYDSFLKARLTRQSF
mmetsp:Transcript_27110/g.105526  ORF Transcript_27110/g.105526 Transcript_27110/m.105526 type:complete len:102 (-) Transcript_27110:222-527(-)